MRDGDWGWGASFADFDNDGSSISCTSTGGTGITAVPGTRARLFLAAAGGRFEDQAAALGFDERVGGRGVVVFDYDGDGDLDVFVGNNNGPHICGETTEAARGPLPRRAGVGDAPNAFAVGAKIFRERRRRRAGARRARRIELRLENPREATSAWARAAARIDTVRWCGRRGGS